MSIQLDYTFETLKKNCILNFVFYYGQISILAKISSALAELHKFIFSFFFLENCISFFFFFFFLICDL